MPTKSAFASKGVWGGAAATFAGTVSFFHTINLVGFAQAIVDNYPAIIAMVGGAVAAYGRIRASMFIAPADPIKAGTALIAGLCLLTSGLTGCSTLGTITPEETSVFTNLGVSNALYFGIQDPAQRAKVAKEMVAAVDAYNLYSNGSVPTPAQFQAALIAYLPASGTKAITVADLSALYGLRYDTFKDYALPSQVTYLNGFLAAVKTAAAPFATP